MASEWAYEIAKEQRRDVETMATNLDAARAQGRREGLEESAYVALSVAARINDKCERMAKGADLVAAEIRAAIAKEPKV